MEKRQERLEKADYDLYQIKDKTSLRRLSFSKFSPEFKTMRKLYGESELAMKSPDTLPKETDDEINDYLICKQYSETRLDFKAFEKLFQRLDSDKAVEEYKASLMHTPDIKLDQSLEMGYEIEMQKRNTELNNESQYY